MHNRTLREIVEGQTVISALADTSVRAAAIAMANACRRPGHTHP